LFAKLWGFKVARVLAGVISRFPFRSPEREKPFGCGLRGELQGEPFAGREATALSIIREIKKVQGGKQAPRNGSLTFPKDLAVKAFSLKGLLNAILIILVPILVRGSNGPPSGHADLGRGLPRLKKNALEGVLVVEVLATSLRPEIVEQEAPEDVEGLPAVGETARVVAVEVRGIIVVFENDLSKKDKRLGNLEAVGRPPIVPYTEENVLSLLGRGAFHEAVLGGFRDTLVTALAGGRNTHDL